MVLADVSQAVIEATIARSLLSQAEAHRANTFRTVERCQRYVQCRALLRVLLAEQVGQQADEITFGEGPFGKPVLSGQAAESGTHFNISHTGSLVLVAISTNYEVGVDIEQIRPGRDIAGIAEHFYALREQQAIRAMCSAARAAAFHSCWCRKESFVKATGLGLQMPLNRFVVNVDPEASARLLSLDYEQLQLSQWQMHTLTMPAGFFGALTFGPVIDY